MDLFKSVLFFILSIHEKLLVKSLKRTIGVKNVSKRKNIFSNGCHLSLDALADEEKEKMEMDITRIIRDAGFEPNNIINYIKMHGTDIYYIDNEKMLNGIGENAGFIYPQKGAKALALSVLTKQGFKLETKDMFVLAVGELNTYYFIYHFYNWYAFKHGISGIESETQELLNKYLYNSTDEDISKLQLSDIYKLKEAIKQDKASIEFVFKLCQAYDSARKALAKVKNEGAQI